MERMGLFTKKVFAEIPLRVEYSLTERGGSLISIIRMMDSWGLKHASLFDGFGNYLGGDRGGINEKLEKANAFPSFLMDGLALFFLTITVAVHELVNAAGGVNEFLLAGEERVRRARDFKFYQRICHAVNFNCFFCGDGRTGDKDFVV